MTVQNGDILKVTFEVSTADGSVLQNVYHMEARLAAPQADATVVNAIETWIEGAYSELSTELVSTLVQGLCLVDEITWNAGTSEWEVSRNVGSFTPTIGFNNAGEALPNMTTAFAVFSTTRPKSKGRKFVPPFGENNQAASYLTGAALANMADYVTRCLAAATIGPGNTLVYGIVRAAAGEFLEALIGVVTNVLGTQRRRRPGVGA